MNHFPLISIALCTYNGAYFLEQQLDSIISQTYPNLEIIVVDDFSVDNTIDILRAYEVKYSHLSIFVNDSNRGVNYSFSRAISLCKGEFIAVSDQDDIWFSNKIEEAYRNIKDDVVMIYSNSILIDKAGNNLNKLMFGRKKMYSGDDPRSLSLYNNIAGHTVLFRADMKKYILPIPQYSHYDWWIGFVALNLGSIVCLDSPFVMHRVHAASASGKASLVKQDRFKAMQRWSETMLSFRNLKYKSFFEELHMILSSRNIRIRKMRLLLFQFKYSRFIFPNKSCLSRFNRARKLNFPHIPD